MLTCTIPYVVTQYFGITVLIFIVIQIKNICNKLLCGLTSHGQRKSNFVKTGYYDSACYFDISMPSLQEGKYLFV